MLSCLVLSYLVFSCPVSCVIFLALSHIVLYCPIGFLLACIILVCVTLLRSYCRDS